MFTFQGMSTKRRRDEDSDSDDGAYEQHQSKKWRQWSTARPPFGQHQHASRTGISLRPSPTPPRTISDLEALTPAHSDESDYGHSPAASGGPVQSSQLDLEDDEDDMDMDEDTQDVTSQPPDSPYATNFMRPAMLNASLFGADPVNSNGRIPTPIHPTFKRGGMNGLGFLTSGAAGGLNTGNASLHVPTIQPTPRKGRQESELDRSRRMPSPISEDEDIPDTPTAFTQSQLSRLSFSQANSADQMETEATLSSLTTSPLPSGRKRSGAVTGLGRFTMGYRDDCEKCRQKVPGHYSHFLP